MALNNDKFSETLNTEITSGSNLPFWFSEQIVPTIYEKLEQDIETDVLVIGGGISGLSTAYSLAKAGKRVVLVEDGTIGSGESGRTTAHISNALDDRYYEIENTFDKETSRLAAESHSAAIEWIANTVRENNIDCHFKRVDGYLFLHESDEDKSLFKEFEASRRAGLPTNMLTHIPDIHGEDDKHCIIFPNQAQFHILLYLEGLAKAFVNLGGTIYNHTRAGNVTSKGATANGFNISASHIVVATNTPINDWATMHTKQWPYRTYVIGAKVPKGKLPYALWWDTGDMESKWVSEPYHYVRLEEFNEEYDMLIAGGEDHRTGQAEEENIKEEDRYQRLEDWTRKHFPDMERVVFNWSGQVMEPVDLLGYIGKNPGEDNIYIITGDSGNGMTHGTLGGIIITDLIMGRENPWASIYSPSRITLNIVKDYLDEAGQMAKYYTDWFTKKDIKEVSELQPGEGGILSKGFKKIAVYRDENNVVHSCTAVCPHMGGILHWNADENTFDCPIHGSRFNHEGKLLNGPCNIDLKKIEIE